MKTAGYDTSEAGKVWTNIIAESEAAGRDRPDPFFATHPPSEERVSALNRLAVKDGGEPGKLNEDQFLDHILPHRAAWLEDELDLGRYAEMQTVLDRLKQAPRGLGVVWYYQGELSRRRAEDGDMVAAVSALRQALTYDDVPPEAYRSLGLVHWMQGRNELASASFRRYLDAAPRASDAAMITHYIKQLR